MRNSRSPSLGVRLSGYGLSIDATGVGAKARGDGMRCHRAVLAHMGRFGGERGVLRRTLRSPSTNRRIKWSGRTDNVE
jgi:hypothetical protein